MKHQEPFQQLLRQPYKWLALWGLLGLVALPVFGAGIDPRADELLKRTSDYLAQDKNLSVHAEIWQDAFTHSGNRVQAGRMVDLQVRRPDRLHSVVQSTRRSHELYYDGKSIILFNRTQNLYGLTNAPGNLDAAVDFVTERLGMVLPLEDLFVSDPYKNAIRNVTSGRYVGPVTVQGVACQHLTFAEPNIDWQIWIQDGSVPVPRKIVITYKDEEGFPQFTALLSNWDFQTKLPDFVFHFEPPVGAVKIPIQEVKALDRKDQKP
ncbi:MAG: hypothetical protein JWM16_2331 [Verrucomicrobiales bacterium]|nr:hypothetical protein [Verrucomicrobiales bacterium]